MVMVLGGCAVVVAGFVLAMIFERRYVVVGIFAAILVTAMIVPYRVLGADVTDRHVGIAPPTVSLFAIGLVVLLASVLCFVRTRLARWRSVALLPFVLYVLCSALFLWEPTPEMWSGAWHYVIAAIAFVLGATVAQHVVDRRARELAVCCVLVVAVVEALVVGSQAWGLPLNPMDAASSALLGGRFNGTTEHPNDLGKLAMLTLAILLSLGHSLTGWYRWAYVAGVGVLGGIVLATQGRAVMIASFVMLVGWLSLRPWNAERVAGRVVALSACGLAALASLSIIFARFAEDPTGGARAEARGIAWQQVATAVWQGTGPNTYLTVTSPWSALSRSGVPVHDTFLLAWAELGLRGVLLLSVPLVVFVGRRLLDLRSPGVRGARAAALVALAPGLALVGATGWGLLGGTVLPLLMFTLGFLSGPADEADGDGPASSDAIGVVDRPLVEVVPRSDGMT